MLSKGVAPLYKAVQYSTVQYISVDCAGGGPGAGGAGGPGPAGRHARHLHLGQRAALPPGQGHAQHQHQYKALHVKKKALHVKKKIPHLGGGGPDRIIFYTWGGGSKSDHFSYFQKLKKKQVVFKISLDHVIFVRENKSQNYSTHFAMGGSHPSIEFSTHFFMGSHHHSKPQ